jgi:hypothetical protein
VLPPHSIHSIVARALWEGITTRIRRLDEAPEDEEVKLVSAIAPAIAIAIAISSECPRGISCCEILSLVVIVKATGSLDPCHSPLRMAIY